MSSPESALRRLAAAFLAGLLLARAAAAADAPSPATAPTREQVSQAVDALRQDPDLKPTHTVPMLRWKKADEKPTAPQDPAWLKSLSRWIWLASRWFADASRWTLWLLGAVAVALVLVSLRHWIGARADPMPQGGGTLPSRVGALDVRPESLPPDIGAAARALWLRGEHRMALSLLYRGALSRLIHAHAVPIRAAHTEPECLRLAQRGLDAAAAAYFARLVEVWQRAVYAGRDPEAAAILALCEGFAPALDARAAPVGAVPALAS